MLCLGHVAALDITDLSPNVSNKRMHWVRPVATFLEEINAVTKVIGEGGTKDDMATKLMNMWPSYSAFDLVKMLISWSAKRMSVVSAWKDLMQDWEMAYAEINEHHLEFKQRDLEIDLLRKQAENAIEEADQCEEEAHEMNYSLKQDKMNMMEELSKLYGQVADLRAGVCNGS